MCYSNSIYLPLDNQWQITLLFQVDGPDGPVDCQVFGYGDSVDEAQDDAAKSAAALKRCASRVAAHYAFWPPTAKEDALNRSLR
jgi:hypothetical protein